MRYEDLIRQPRETVAALAAYLGVDASAAALDRMVDSLALRDEASDVYRTAASAEASIGRWQQDLAPGVLECVRRSVRSGTRAFRLPLRETASSAARRPKEPHVTVDTSIVRFRLGACLLLEVDARSDPEQPPH